jgi:uncharacterized protein
LKLHLERNSGKNAIVAIEPDAITVNDQVYRESVLVPSEGMVQLLGSLQFADLTADHFQQLLAAKPEIVLLGTGNKQRFVHPRLIAALSAARIGVECMATPAACRTFSILVSEGRRCDAILLLDQPN